MADERRRIVLLHPAALKKEGLGDDSRKKWPDLMRRLNLTETLDRLAVANPQAARVLHEIAAEELATVASNFDAMETSGIESAEILLLNRWCSSVVPMPHTPHTRFVLDFDLRYLSVEQLRPGPVPIPIARVLGRRMSDLLSAGLTHQFANAVQSAIEGAETCIRYPLRYKTGILMSEARITVDPTARLIVSEVTRLGLQRTR